MPLTSWRNLKEASATMPKEDRVKKTGKVHKVTIPFDEDLVKEAEKRVKERSRRQRVGGWRLDEGVNKGGRRLFG
jgi:hypothetical protein